MVFATGSLVNANTSEVSEGSRGDCAERAWRYGTFMSAGQGDYADWYYTERYYNRHC